LCQAVLDIYQDVTEMAEWLADLRRRNLFLHRISSQSPEREPTYAYQSLFLSFLRTELSRFLPSNEVRALHRRAARAWEQRGDQEQALYHFQQADDEPEVARLLGQMTSDYLQQGRLESLARWLDQLGPSVRSRYPRLTLSAGQLRQAEGRGEEARSLYLQAVADFEAQQDRAAQGDSLLALAELEFLRGRYDDGIQFGERALACWDEAHNGRVADALCVLGRLRASLGDLPAAADSLERAERLARTGDDPLRVFRVLRSQAWVAYLQGAYHRAIGLNHWAEREAGDDVPQEIMMTFQNPVPSILRMWGQGDAAWHAAHRRLEAARQMRDRIALSSAWVDVGNLHWDRGVYSEAEEAFRKAVEGAKETGEDGLVRLCGEAHLACVCALRNNLNEAVELAEAMLSRCQDRGAPSLEIAIAQTALAGVHLRVPDVLEQDVFPALLKAYHTFKRLNVRYGVFASGILISRAYSQMNEAEPGEQARGYLVEALGMAAAESYIQPLVTWHDITLPLMLFALREGIGHRFVSSALARIGPEALPPVIELARDDDSLIRERAALALGVMRDEVEAGDVMDDEMYEP
jgi:ATP/maltotriose-dependent transcriptional regulator MalT